MYSDVQKMAPALSGFCNKNYLMNLSKCTFSPASLKSLGKCKLCINTVRGNLPCRSSAATTPAKRHKGVEFHKWPFLSSLFLHSFNSSPPFHVGEKQRKVDNVCWHADHAEIPQNKGENGCKIKWAGHRHPRGEDQKHCCPFR